MPVDSMSTQEVFDSFVGKRVFITGHTGFKGSWLTFLLKEIGAEIMGFSLPPPSTPSHFELLNLQQNIIHVNSNLCDVESLNKAMQSFQPEYVFHLAAQALVKQSYENPLTTIETNVMGSTYLLEAVKQCSSVRSLVYITSDKCYENVEWVWGYRENDSLGGADPYSASKAAAEIIFSAYARSYFYDRPELGAATARAGNVIGGGDWASNRIVPDCIRAINSRQAIRLRNPHATRPWQHVLEPLTGYLQLAANLRKRPTSYVGSWNFGPSTQEVRTVHDVATAITTYLGRGTVEMDEVVAHQHEARLLQLNCDKAHQLLNWHPRWSVDQTIKATAYWYKAALEGGDVSAITRSQIYDYFKEIS